MKHEFTKANLYLEFWKFCNLFNFNRCWASHLLGWLLKGSTFGEDMILFLKKINESLQVLVIKIYITAMYMFIWFLLIVWLLCLLLRQNKIIGMYRIAWRIETHNKSNRKVGVHTATWCLTTNFLSPPFESMVDQNPLHWDTPGQHDIGVTTIYPPELFIYQLKRKMNSWVSSALTVQIWINWGPRFPR